MAAVHTVEAYDADVGDNARITYFITGNTSGGVKTIFKLFSDVVTIIVSKQTSHCTNERKESERVRRDVI